MKFKSVKNMNLDEIWVRLNKKPTLRNFKLLQTVIINRISVAGSSATLSVAIKNAREANKIYGGILSYIRYKIEHLSKNAYKLHIMLYKILKTLLIVSI